jgi:hypothetical protein
MAEETRPPTLGTRKGNRSRLGQPKGSTAFLTTALTKAICAMLEIAVPEKYAAEANGIAEDTFHAWMRKGEEWFEPYLEFRRAVTRAREGRGEYAYAGAGRR